MKKEKRIWIGFFGGMIPAFLIVGLLGCSFSGNHFAANDASPQTVRMFWMDIAKMAVDQSVALLNRQAGRTGGKPEMTVLSSAGCAMIHGVSTQACLDGLRESATVSEGEKTLLAVHTAGRAPLWFFVMDKTNGNGVYSEVDPKSLNPEKLTRQGAVFSVQNLKNVKADTLFADLSSAHENIIRAKAFNGNEFRIIGIANLLLKNAPYDLIRAVQYHDHYCPGVTSGYFLVKYLEKHFPLTDSYGSYFVLSIPPWCKDDALITLLNATPGKGGYGVFHLNAEDTESLRKDAKHITGAYFRWNGNATAPAGEGTVLSFDFAEAREACNWEEKTPWNGWESRLKMDLWYLDHLDTPERFVKPIPVLGKTVFSLKDIVGVSKPADLSRPGVNPLVALGLTDGSRQ